MERRFQYYVAFANHTQYRDRAMAREHNNTMENLYYILRIFFMSLNTNYVLMHFILRICAQRRRSLNEAFLVKISNIW